MWIKTLEWFVPLTVITQVAPTSPQVHSTLTACLHISLRFSNVNVLMWDRTHVGSLRKSFKLSVQQGREDKMDSNEYVSEAKALAKANELRCPEIKALTRPRNNQQSQPQNISAKSG